MAVRQRTLDLQFLRPGTEHLFALEQRLQGVDPSPGSLLRLAKVRFCERPCASR